jgi:hypothetical protein
MRLRSVVLGALAAAGAAAVVVRRRRGEPERVTLAFADGSTLALEPGAQGAERLIELGRVALAAARG